MSPLEFEAYRNIGLEIEGDGLEDNPAIKTDKKGKEIPLKPGEVVNLRKGDKVSIPETLKAVRVKSVESDLSVLRDKKPNPEAGSSLHIVTKVKGVGVTEVKEGKEPPFLANPHPPIWDRNLEKNPRDIWVNKQRTLKISWRKE